MSMKNASNERSSILNRVCNGMRGSSKVIGRQCNIASGTRPSASPEVISLEADDDKMASGIFKCVPIYKYNSYIQV